MRRTEATRGIVCLAALLCVLRAATPCAGQRARGARRRDEDAAAAREHEFEARRLLRTAQNVLAMGENERGVRMLETILERHPQTLTRFEAYLALGRHYLRAGGDKAKAIAYLRRLNELKEADKPLAGQRKDLYLEGLYLTGVAYFEVHNYAASCAVLRKITRGYPNTVWANQSYYYIGMCHFAQKHWNEAVRNLSLVGTFVDVTGGTTEYIEAGRRFYVKVQDGDLPVLRELGREIQVTVQTASGDKAVLKCAPLSEREGVFIASVPTEMGAADATDDVLQVVGGDEITVAYVDVNTKEGERNVSRKRKVRVVSTGALGFTVSTYDSAVSAAFLGQPLYVLLDDADLDASAKRDQIAVKVMSRYRSEELQGPTPTGLGAGLEYREEQERYKVRDEVTVTLQERGDRPVHSGRFGGRVQLQAHQGDQPADKTDKLLACMQGDEIVARYIDERHVAGTSPRQVEAKVSVIGEIDNTPQARQDHVPNPVTRARKKLVEATAFLELARIFDSMGLKDGAKTKAEEGLQRVDPIIRTTTPIPAKLKQDAFKLKWELYMAQEDYRRAIATCRVFHRMYPDSPYVDEALMSIGKIRKQDGDPRGAIAVFRQVLRLPKSQAKAEAQYLIAQATEAPGTPAAMEAAIAQYRICAERYADSHFAGPSLAKLVQHHIDTKDFSRANDLLEQIFQDHPDGDFLDLMLLKWVGVAWKMGDYAKAKAKCEQLIFSYPGSGHARKAKEYLPNILQMLEKSGKGGTEGARTGGE